MFLRLTNSLRLHKTTSTIGGVVVVCVLVIIWIISRSSYRQFVADYNAYQWVDQELVIDAFEPGAPNNEARNELNRLLAAVLTGTIKPAPRAQLALHGKEILIGLQAEIDKIGLDKDKVDPTISALDADAHAVGNIASRARMQEIVDLAKKQSAAIGDIRGLSYRANYQITAIFDRIIADQGALSPAFVTQLNSDIPDMEAQFNRRTNLYKDLQDTNNSMEIAYKSLKDSYSWGIFR